jgi:hypothetical protein
VLDVLVPALAGALAAAGAAFGPLLAMRGERRRLEAALAAEAIRVDHLLSLLARKEAPAAESWWQADAAPVQPLVPPNAVWDDSGLYYHDPDEAE